MKSKFTLFILAFVSFSFQQQAQTLDYLKPLGQKLVDDILEQTDSALVNEEVMRTYFNKAIIPTLEKPLTEAEIETAIREGLNSTTQAYKESTSQLKTYLSKAEIELSEFSLWANVPMQVENHESKSDGPFSVPDPNKDNLSTYTVHFLVGDFAKRIILQATVVGLNGNYYIFNLDSPVSYYEFMGGDYHTLYSNIYSLIEKQLGARSSIIDGSPLIGEKVDDTWNKCTVQLLGDNPQTLARTLASDDKIFNLNLKIEIKVELFKNISAQDGLVYFYDILSIVAQEFNINSLDQKVKVFIPQALSENKENGALTGSLQLKRGSGDKKLFDLKLELIPNANNTADLTLWLTTGS